MITSRDNPALKEIRKLSAATARARSGLFVAEGEDLLQMADLYGWSAIRRVCAAGSGIEGDEVEPALLAEVSNLGSGTRAIGIYERRWGSVPRTGAVVHLHGLADPGNVGTCIRSAHALGAAAVTIAPGTADPFGPKAVRASMGSVFAIPVAECSNPLELRGTKIALATRGGVPPTAVAAEACVLLVGSERGGLSADLVAQADEAWTFPLSEGAESLNAAAACAIALFVANRIPS